MLTNLFLSSTIKDRRDIVFSKSGFHTIKTKYLGGIVTMKKRTALALLLASAILGMTACGTDKPAETSEPAAGGETEETAAETSGEVPFVGGTIYKFDDNFMSYVRRGMETYAKDKINLELVDSQNNQAMQGDQVDTFLAKGAKALAINLVDPKAAPSIIDKASANNVPVIFFNKEPDESAMNSYDKVWFVGTDSKESGIIQGQLVVDAWNANKEAWDKNKDGKIQYVMLKGEPGHPDAEARTSFSISTITDAGIEVEELAIDTGMWDAAKATEKMDAWISSFGDKIEVVLCNNDGMALGSIASLERAGYTGDKALPVIGVDAIPEALEMIKSGKMFGTVLNDSKNQSQATVELARNVALGKDPLEGTSWKFDDKKAVRVPYVAITKDNLNVAEETYQ